MLHAAIQAQIIKLKYFEKRKLRSSQKVILHHFSLNIMTYFQLVVNPLKSTYKYLILKTPTWCFKGTGQVKHAHYLNQPFKICKDQLLEEISRVRDFQLITVRNNGYLSAHAYLAICGIWNFAFCTKKNQRRRVFGFSISMSL